MFQCERNFLMFSVSWFHGTNILTTHHESGFKLAVVVASRISDSGDK